jgi:hypothetical protein
MGVLTGVYAGAGWYCLRSSQRSARGREPAHGRVAASRVRSNSGLILVEAIVAAVILVVAALGGLRCQYYAAWNGRIAHAEVVATQVAQLLLEDWKSSGGSPEYDPAGLGLGFTGPLAIPSAFPTTVPLGAVLHGGVYGLTLNDTPMRVMLEYVDVAQDDRAKATLRELVVVVRFLGSTSEDTRLAALPPVILPTYVRVDASSG